MIPALAGKTIAILIANGFDENQMTELQRALTKAKAKSKTIAPEQGVVNGWQGTGWGHYFPIDAQISEALGSDYDILVIPGGERGIAKLTSNAHARRIVSHFFDAGKPIATIGAGAALLALSPKVSGYTVAAPLEAQDVLKAAGVALSEEKLEIFDNLLTSTGEDIHGWVDATLSFFSETEPVQVAA